METNSDQLTDPRLPLMEPEPKVAGVKVHQVDFASRGEGHVPFQGAHFTIEPGATSRLDVHEVRECWMMVRGKGLLTYDNRQFRVSSGDFCYFEPQKAHQVYNDGQEDLLIYTVWWGSSTA